MSNIIKLPSNEARLNLEGNLQGYHKNGNDVPALRLEFFRVTDASGAEVYKSDLGQISLTQEQYISTMRPNTPTSPMKISLELVSEGTMGGKPWSDYKINRIETRALKA